MISDSSPVCEPCGRELLADVAGHYRFHRDAAVAFLELLDQDGRRSDAFFLVSGACRRLSRRYPVDSGDR